jgi:hypothetical protein
MARHHDSPERKAQRAEISENWSHSVLGFLQRDLPRAEGSHLSIRLSLVGSESD